MVSVRRGNTVDRTFIDETAFRIDHEHMRGGFGLYNWPPFPLSTMTDSPDCKKQRIEQPTEVASLTPHQQEVLVQLAPAIVLQYF